MKQPASKVEYLLPQNAFRALRRAKPEVAIGLGVMKGENTREILCEGPLWRDASRQVEQDACWHIGSITKSITSTLVLQQVEQGKLNLERPIGDYLLQFDQMHANWRAITLKQLLSHTSGIAPNPPSWQFFKWRELDTVKGRQQVLANAWEKPFKMLSGAHRYSNLGYMLIGRILEEILGMPWEFIVRQNIAKPLGLKTLGFGAPVGLGDPKGHRKSILRLRPMERNDIAADNPSWLGPAGTIHMSIGDMLTYGRAHLKALRGELPDFLSQQSSVRMQTPISNDYGLGWVVQNDTVWHNGSNTMWYALLVIDPVSDTVVVATQNASVRTSKIDAIARETVSTFRSS